MAFAKLVLLCAFMFLSTLAIGLIPISFAISQRRLKMVTTIGVGLLIGTAFIVIIPEGVATYYASTPPPKPHEIIKYQPLLNNTHAHAHDEHGTHDTHSEHTDDDDDDYVLHGHDTKPGHYHRDGHPHVHEPARKRVHTAGSHTAHSEHGTHSGHDHEDHGLPGHVHSECGDMTRPSSWIGAALAFGFVMMLLVDRMSGGHSHGHALEYSPDASGHARHGSDIQMTVMSSPSHTTNHRTPSADGHSHHINPNSNRATSIPAITAPVSHNQSASYGILIHSAIDGIALGAISVNSNPALETAVFLAIVLHKAPAAFGLASFFMYQGRSKHEIKYQLTIFALAAPVMALFTYFVFAQYTTLVSTVESTTASNAWMNANQMLGLCLLFSGGTFLFTIAVHILPEIKKDGEVIEWKYTWCLVAGILLPMLFSYWGHAH